MLGMSSSRGTESLHRLSSGVAQPASYRDASNQAGPSRSSGPWKAPAPTPIHTPNNRPPSNLASAANPFSNGLSSRKGKSRSGNNTSVRTVLTGPRTSENFPGVYKGGQSLSSPHNADIVINESHQEDIGKRIFPRQASSPSGPSSLSRVTRRGSPDELDCLVSDTGKEIKPNRMHPVPLGMVGRYRMAQDGGNTKNLARKLQHKLRRQLTGAQSTDDEVKEVIQIDDEDDDPIQNWSDISDPSPSSPLLKPSRRSSPPVRRGTVNERVQQFEQKQASGAPIPHINLNNVGMVRKMKPKGKSPQRTLSGSDTIGPSGFKASSGAATGTPERKGHRFTLPLEAHIYGTSFQSRGKDDISGWFCLEGSQLTVSKSQDSSVKPDFEIRPNFGFGDMQFTAPPSDGGEGKTVVIMFRTHGALRLHPNTNRSGFKHGSSGDDGNIVFKFNTKHDEWDHKEYRDLISTLRTAMRDRSFSSLDGPASSSVWEAACNAQSEIVSDNDAILPKRLKPDDKTDTTDSTLPDKEITIVPARRMEAQAESSTRTRPRPRPISNTTITYPVRRTTRSSTAAISARTSPVPDPDELVLVYPPSGTGAVNLTNADLKRLDEGQFLNDTLIEFALKLWLNDLREKNPALAEQTHIFSSFFYRKIQVKNKEEGYSSVRKWTSKFDLFKKKYIIVPINEHLHWYLAIICNPEFVLQPPPPQPPKAVSAVQTRKRKRDSEALEQESAAHASGSNDNAHDSPTATADDEHSVENLLNGCNISQRGGEDEELQYPDTDGGMTELPTESSTEPAGPSREISEAIEIDDDVQEGNDGHVPMDVDVVGEVEQNTASSAIPCTSFYGTSVARTDGSVLSPEVPYYESAATSSTNVDVPELDLDNDEPVGPESGDFRSDETYVFTFDSLGGRHPAAAKNLGQYLQMEAKDKKGLDISQTTLATGVTALVPAQPNFCDCGVYLIHFVEMFMSDPEWYMKKIVTTKGKNYASKEREDDWKAQAVESLRETLRAKALTLSEEWKKEKAAREEQKKVAAEASSASKPGPEAEVIPDSDDDEIVVTEVKNTKKGGRAKPKVYRFR